MHNCGTCARWSDTKNGCRLKKEDCWNDHPAYNRPCPHGKPVVASAVAGVEFEVLPRGVDVIGHHAHGGISYATWTRWDGMEHFRDDHEEKFCSECGLRMPTAQEVAQMYEAWRDANHDKP
jgi:hypothetical protein